MSPIDIPFRHGTLDTPMRRAASVRRDHVAVIDGDVRLTYAELDRRIAGARAGLRELGLESGDRVGGLALNSSRHLEATMGVPTTNLVLNDLNFRLALPELEFIVNDSGARVLLADERHWETAAALLDRCDCLEQLVWLSDGPAPDGEATWDELCAATPVDTPADLDADSVAGITYTGGTTGLPKGVDADARQLDGERQAPDVGQPGVPRRPLLARHADVPFGGRREHLRPHARRRYPRDLPGLRTRPRRTPDRAATRSRPACSCRR